MSPNPNPSAPWWQTVVVAAVNAALAAVVNHYIGPEAAAASLVGGTAVAHILPSPAKKP